MGEREDRDREVEEGEGEGIILGKSREVLRLCRRLVTVVRDRDKPNQDRRREGRYAELTICSNPFHELCLCAASSASGMKVRKGEDSKSLEATDRGVSGQGNLSKILDSINKFEG